MVNTRTNAELAAAVQAAVDAMLPQIREQVREEYRTGASGGNPPPATIHTWLERFNKQKPHSFEKAVAPVDAENWISHMEKIFDVMDCNDAFKTRLAVYKFEGDALAWWKAYKTVSDKRHKSGDVITRIVNMVSHKESRSRVMTDRRPTAGSTDKRWMYFPDRTSIIPPIRDVDLTLSYFPRADRSPKLLNAWHQLELKELKGSITDCAVSGNIVSAEGITMDPVWSLEAKGEYYFKSVRQLIDDSILPKEEVATKWVKVMPIKINVFAWRVRLDKLPTRLNLFLKVRQGKWMVLDEGLWKLLTKTNHKKQQSPEDLCLKKKKTEKLGWLCKMVVECQSVKVKEFQERCNIKAFQEWYEHVGPEVASPQGGKVTSWRRDYAWLMISRCSRSLCQIQVQGTSSNQEVNDHNNIFTRESQEYELKTEDKA
ncbi:hypothetical protein Tco_1343858 [Tanacetum coccineum]